MRLARQNAESAPGLNGGRDSQKSVTRYDAGAALHPAWRAFVCYCAELQHGEIEKLRIQDGLPMLAEVTRKKVKFAH